MMTVPISVSEIQYKPIICSRDKFYKLRIVLHGPNNSPPTPIMFYNEDKSGCLVMKYIFPPSPHL